jgi:hypothetical protein
MLNCPFLFVDWTGSGAACAIYSCQDGRQACQRGLGREHAAQPGFVMAAKIGHDSGHPMLSNFQIAILHFNMRICPDLFWFNYYLKPQ